jgi:prepilin-type N-terminal cleavage/methylation domain-containing protein
MIRRAIGGFTLLELLVVLALIALLTGLVAPALTRWAGSATERGWRSDLEALLRAQPLRAFRSGNELTVTDKMLRAELAQAPDDLIIEVPQPLRYSGVGRAQGGEVVVSRRGREPERWVVLPITGEVQRIGSERP